MSVSTYYFSVFGFENAITDNNTIDDKSSLVSIGNVKLE